MHPNVRTVTFVLVACAVAALSSATAFGGRAVVAPCRGVDVTATFTGVRGSAGAGQISYVLRLRNRSGHACWVSGLPVLRLLGRAGQPLPTHERPEHPGALTAVRVTLARGGYAAATARFSPDIPGPGEPVLHACEPTAFSVRVMPPPGGGITVTGVTPPTPVCEHGTLTLSVLVSGRTGPHTP
jgi:Protein of unknown function (DUF4232)